MEKLGAVCKHAARPLELASLNLPSHMAVKLRLELLVLSKNHRVPEADAVAGMRTSVSSVLGWGWEWGWEWGWRVLRGPFVPKSSAKDGLVIAGDCGYRRLLVSYTWRNVAKNRGCFSE